MTGLNTMLATLEVVAMNVKGRHWNMTGQNFRSNHLLLDDIWSTLTDSADKVAETIRVLGGMPIHTPHSFAAETMIMQQLELGSPETMMRDTRDELREIIRAINESAHTYDPTTQNDLTAMSSQLRHWLYFLNSQING